MPKKFELKKAAPGTPVSQEAHHPIVPTQQAGEEEDEVVIRTRGSRPKFSRQIPVDRIHANPKQARKTFDEQKLAELAAGMQEHGWVGGGLPVRAHPTVQNEYQLVFGERRLRAAKLAGLVAIPCEVSTFSDDDMVEIGLIENIQRADLSRYEEGMAYRDLIDLRNEDGNARYSIRSLAKRLGKDKSYVEDRLQYARAPEDVQQLAQEIDIAPRMARELAHIENEAAREVAIEAVRRNEADIEDVKLYRKQLDSQGANTSVEEDKVANVSIETELVDDLGVSEPGESPEVVVPEKVITTTPLVQSPEAQSWLLQAQLNKDSGRIAKLLQAWVEKPDFAKGLIKDDMRVHIKVWEVLIEQIKENWE